MLTVKHIAADGREGLYQAYEVNFAPTPEAQRVKTRSPIESAHAGGSVMLIKPAMNPGEIGSYTLGLEGGTIFVMNDVGKTVSRYDLGASDVAYGTDPITLGKAA
jgi:hypothetical protein